MSIARCGFEFFTLPSGFSWRSSGDQTACLYLVLKGGCAIESPSLKIEIKESYSGFVPAGEEYSCEVWHDDSLIIKLAITEGPYATLLHKDEAFTPFRIEDSHSYFLISKAISAMLQNSGDKNLSGITASLAEHIFTTFSNSGYLSENPISPVIQTIYNNPLGYHSLEHYSEMVSLHPMTVAKKFRRLIGCSIGEFRQRMRVERAFYRLIKTSTPLSQISMVCGYADQSHMTRSFRRYFDVTPAQLRNIDHFALSHEAAQTRL